MLHIIPIQSKDDQKALAEAFSERFDERAFAYLAAEEDERGEREAIGFMQFTLGEDEATVLCLREAPGCDDPEAMQILARAAFSFIHRVGVRYVAVPDGRASDKLTAALRMTDSGDGRKTLDLSHYFALPCDARAAINEQQPEI